MNKILRYSFIVLLALVCGGVNAQTYLWQEDFSSFEKDAVPTGGDYSYACVGSGTKIYNEKLAGGEAPEILVAKSGGSFSATIKLNGKSGEMTLAFRANRSDLKVAVTNATLGEVTAAGNDYSYPVSVAAGTESITITFSMTNSKNARLDNIKLYQGEGKKPAGLSWGTASREVTIGAEDNVFPTLTNPNGFSATQLTYTSSDTEVATIDGAGNITLVAAGTTIITASFDGNKDYEAGSVSYTLTVKAAPTVDITNTPETAYTVAKAKELIAAGEGLDAKVYVKGKISKIVTVSIEYGNANYNISDDGTTDDDLIVFRGKYLDGEVFTSEDQIKVGDEVIVYGKLVNYNNTTPEINTGSEIYSLNGQTSNINGITTDAASVNAPAYNLAGQKVSSSYKGVVIKAGKKHIQK